MAQASDALRLEFPGSPLLHRLSPVLIGVAILCAYHNACRGPFIFDDLPSIPNNPAIRTLWPIWMPMFPAGNLGIAGRPLVGLSFAINYAIDGLNPRGYHAGNVLIHIAAALTLFGVARRLLRRWSLASAEGIAMVIALIWAVHPIQTETVTYIVNRSEGMLGLFSLLTLYSFLRSLDSPRRRMWQALSILASLAAVACKEVGAMLGPIVLLLDVLLVTGSWMQTLRQRKWFYAALLLDWVLLVGLLQTVTGHNKLGGAGIISPLQYLAMQSQILLMYLKLCFWPSPLVISYVDWPVPVSPWSAWPTLAAMGALFVATVVGVIRKYPAAAAGVVFFLVLAPTSSLLPLPSEPAAERRMYLPLAAIVFLLVLAARRLSRKLPRRRVVMGAIVALLVIGLGQATVYRNDDYATDVAIWKDTLAKRPNNWFALSNMAAAVQPTEGFAGAMKWYDAALRVKPDFGRARSNRGMCLIQLGRREEGLVDMLKGAELEPDRSYLWAYLGWGLQLAGRPAEAEVYLRKALTINPADPVALKRLQSPAKPLPTTSPNP